MNDQARIAALALEGVERRYGRGRNDGRGSERREPGAVAGPIGGAHRPVRRRKVDASASGGSIGAARRRRSEDRRRGDLDHERRQADGAEAHGNRLRLPVPSLAARVLGAREPRPAADDRRALARSGRGPRARTARLSRPRGSARAIVRRNCRAASSSASPSRARSPTAHESCWPTSRPAISIRRPPTTCSARSPNWPRRAASPPSSPPTTWISPPAWTAGSRSATGGSARWDKVDSRRLEPRQFGPEDVEQFLPLWR